MNDDSLFEWVTSAGEEQAAKADAKAALSPAHAAFRKLPLAAWIA